MKRQPITDTHAAVHVLILASYGADIWELAPATPCGLCRDTHTFVALRAAEGPDDEHPRIEQGPVGTPVTLPCPACRIEDFRTHPAVKRHRDEY
jgi:hypothetical protein